MFAVGEIKLRKSSVELEKLNFHKHTTFQRMCNLMIIYDEEDDACDNVCLSVRSTNLIIPAPCRLAANSNNKQEKFSSV